MIGLNKQKMYQMQWLIDRASVEQLDLIKENCEKRKRIILSNKEQTKLSEE